MMAPSLFLMTALEKTNRAPFAFPLARTAMVLEGASRLLRVREDIKRLAGLARTTQAEFDVLTNEALDDLAKISLNAMDMKIECEGDMPEFSDHDRFLFVGNHLNDTLATWALLNHFAHLGPKRSSVVMKMETHNNPLARFILTGSLDKVGSGIFIDRDDKEAAIASIREACQRSFSPGTAVTLFTDQHRPKPNRLKNERRTWTKKYPNLDVPAWLKYTCFPRTGGVREFLEATNGVPLQVIGFAAAVDRPFELGSRLHVALRPFSREELFEHPNPYGEKYNCTREPIDDVEANLRAWAIDHAVWQNQKIGEWLKQD